MKNLIILTLIIILSTACRAQQPVAKISSKQVKTDNVVYNIVKPDNKVTEVINSNNKLTNIKQVAPNLTADMPIPAYSKFDDKLLIDICADAIPLSKLEKLPKGYGDWLYIVIKINPKGEPLEMEFLVRNTSLITLGEIQQIEQKILKSSFRVTFTKGIERYFEGANYFEINVPIRYSDMLQLKQSN